MPAGSQWTVTGVHAIGLSYAGGDLTVEVRFYADANGLPGALEYDQPLAASTTAGTFDVALTTPAVLGPGVHWLSFQVTTPGVNGEWFWYDRATRTGSPAAYRSATSTGCTTWTVRSTCQGGYPYPDQLFSLSGTSGPAPTTPVTGGTAPTFEQLVKLPSDKKCRPSRTLKIRLTRVSGATVTKAVFKVGHTKTTVTGKRLGKPIRLQHLPAGTYKLKATLSLDSGATVKGSRSYRTC